MRRLDGLQDHLERVAGPTTPILAEARHLRTLFVELRQYLQAATRAGEHTHRAPEDRRAHALHKDLALYVARVESEFGISGPEPHPRQAGADVSVGRGTLGTSSLGILQGLGESKLPNDSRTPTILGTSGQLPSFTWGRSGNKPPMISAIRSGASFNQVKSPRAEMAGRSIVAEMNRFATLQPQLKGLPQHVFLEIANRAQELDNVLFKLQRRGNELQALAARGGTGTSHLETEGQQFVASLENFAASQAAFMKEVVEVTRTRRSQGGYVAYRPKDLR